VSGLFDPSPIGRLELERAVLDIEVSRETGSESVEDLARVRVLDRDHVRRDHVQPTRDRPGVEIVDVLHALRLQDMPAHLV